MTPSQENEIRQAVENRYTYSNESWLEYATVLLKEVDHLRSLVLCRCGEVRTNLSDPSHGTYYDTRDYGHCVLCGHDETCHRGDK